MDEDGYGVGSDCDGADCNDLAASVHAADECDAYCATGPAPGCPCDALEPAICYAGPAATLGVGECQSGLSSCVAGTWSACEGQVLPREEACDGHDEDCDGVADDGVTNACGDCSSECEEDCVGIGCPEGFDPGSAGEAGVSVTPDGAVTIDDATMPRHHLIWIANSSEGTVSKIDTRTREEIGRFDTGPGVSWIDSPSRTTVNLAGDVVVANRGATGEATKFYGEDCPDVDGDGRIETSTGADDVYAWQEDECFAWSTAIGSGARGSGFELRTGLDAALEEYVWVGSTGLSVVKELDAETGEPTGREISAVYPYGLAIGPDNVVWTFNDFSAGIVEVTTTDEDLEKTIHPYPAGVAQYGITVDSQGRVWVAGGNSTARYDPDSDEWEQPGGGAGGGGIAVDGNDDAWTGEEGSAEWGVGGPYKIDGETLEVTAIGAAFGGHGWAVDFDGYVWCVPFVGTRAYVIDPDTLEEDDRVEGLVGAYTYSDMTGFQLANAAKPLGTFPVDFEACDGGTVRWISLSWEADVPDETSIGFAVRTAEDEASLASAARIDLGTTPPLASPVSIADALSAAGATPGRLLRVDVTLASETRDASPLLRSLSVQRSCER